MYSAGSWLSGCFGIMIHYLPPYLETRGGEMFESVDACVAEFDIPRFVEQLEAAGADFLIFTLGQNSGMYNSPNSVLEGRIGPGHCAAVRDLALELASAVKKRGIRFIAYLPMEAHCNDSIKVQLGWKTMEENVIARQEEFQQLWCNVIQEWAIRFGSLLDGWFFDGAGHLRQTPEDQAALFAAARAGNPEALITMNFLGFDLWDGETCRAGENFFSGETTLLKNGLPLVHWRNLSEARRIALGLPENHYPERVCYHPESGFMPGISEMVTHALVPVDAFWWHKGNVEWLDGEVESRYRNPETLKKGEMEPPIYSLSELDTLQKAFLSVGGALTLNVGVFMDGALGEETLELLIRLKELRSAGVAV